MPKNANQKAKLLFLRDLMLNQTDEEHPIAMSEILRMLEAHGIVAERKSILDDFKALADYGITVENKRGKGYFSEDAMFELPELKLLVDVVQSAKFLTEKKSRELIEKLQQLTSTYNAAALSRQIVIAGRIKTPNEAIYYSVDSIHTAIASNKQIRFKYYEWSFSKELKPRHGGKDYIVSPFTLLWDDENYYLVAYEHDSEMIKHYRVDKMKSIDILDEAREGKKLLENFCAAEYATSTFGMFGGETETITLECDAKLIGAMIDRFGTTSTIFSKDDKFRITIHAKTSPRFFGWICGFGGGIKIVSPSNTKKEFEDYLNNLCEKCK